MLDPSKPNITLSVVTAGCGYLYVYIPDRLSITCAKVLRYFDATKYFSVKMTQTTIFFEFYSKKVQINSYSALILSL